MAAIFTTMKAQGITYLAQKFLAPILDPIIDPLVKKVKRMMVWVRDHVWFLRKEVPEPEVPTVKVVPESEFDAGKVGDEEVLIVPQGGTP